MAILYIDRAIEQEVRMELRFLSSGNRLSYKYVDNTKVKHVCRLGQHAASIDHARFGRSQCMANRHQLNY